MSERSFARWAWAALAALTLCAADVSAQSVAATPGRPATARRPIDQLAAVVQRRLALTDDQATRLRQVTGHVATQRQDLLKQEREARRVLRTQMAAGNAADQQEVGRRLDDLMRLQQRRVELLTAEQRDLSAFLTPLQRAQFLAMQERAFRAAQQLRQRRAANARSGAVDP